MTQIEFPNAGLKFKDAQYVHDNWSVPPKWA